MRNNPKSLNNLIPEALPPPIGSALANRGRPILEPADTGSIGHRGNSQQLFTEATCVALSLPKPCHANPIHVHEVLDFYCELIASVKPHKSRLQTWTHKAC